MMIMNKLMDGFSAEDLAMAKKFSNELGVIQFKMHVCHILEEQLSVFMRLIDNNDTFLLKKLTKEQRSACGVWEKLKNKETECYAKIIAYKKNCLFLNYITQEAEYYVRSFSDREIFKYFDLSIKEDNTSVIESLLQF